MNSDKEIRFLIIAPSFEESYRAGYQIDDTDWAKKILIDDFTGFCSCESILDVFGKVLVKYGNGEHFKLRDLRIKFNGYDSRIKKDTYMVTTVRWDKQSFPNGMYLALIVEV